MSKFPQRGERIQTYYLAKIGARAARALDPVMTDSQVAAVLGVSRQRVWQLQNIALGKLVVGLIDAGWRTT